MFSGGDSSGDGVNSLNQYSNFRLPGQGAGNGNGSIDWALLAAQWIQMRDNSTSNLDISANMGIMSEIPPPPPSISITDINYQMLKSMNEQQQLPNIKKTDIPTTPTTSTNIKKTAYEEKGEADMDMDDDDDFANNSNAKESKFEPSSPPPPAPSMQLSNASAVAPPVGIMQPPHWYVQQQEASVQLPTPINIGAVNIAGNSANALPWPAWPPRMSVPPPSTATTITGPTVPSVPSGSAVSDVPSNVNATAHIPSLMKLNVANPNVMKTMSNTQPEIDPNAVPPIDTAKRKILPAWIREGLEKMEREKQKQMERQLQQNNVISPTETPNEVSAQSPKLVNELTVKHKTTNALESGASSGNDDDEPDDSIDVHHTKGMIKAQQQITKHRNSDSEAEYELTSKHKTSTIDNLDAHLDDDATNKENNDTIIDDDDDVDEDVVEERQVSRGYEERLADLMIIVRRTLTELLLEVTNDEISSIAQEAVKSQKTKASSAQVIRKSALSSITGKLGLAAYANTSSDEDSDASDDDTSDHDEKDVDSEEEIKATIRQKRRNFAKISEEIEERVSANAQREEQKLKYYTQVERQQSEMTSDGNPKRGDQDRTGDIDAERYGDCERRGAVSASDVGKGFEREFGETTTETKLPHSNGKRSKLEHSKRKERTTRFSDNKDNKATSLAYITQIQKQQSQHQQQQNSTVASTSSTNFPLKPTVTAADALNSLYTMPVIYNTTHSTSGINNMLSAAELALEKAAAKQKSSSSSSSTHKRRHSLKRQRHSSERDKRKQRRSRSSTSTSTTTSSTSSSSTTSSSSSSSSTTTPSERSRSNGSRRRDDEHRKHHSSSKHHKRSHSRSRSSNKQQQQQQQQQKHASSSSSSYDRKRSERSERSRYETHSRHRHQHSRRHSSGSDDRRDYRKSRSRSRSPYTSSSSRHRRRRHH